MPKFYGAGRWDPKLILLQMTCMQRLTLVSVVGSFVRSLPYWQSSHYVARGLFLMVCHGASLSLDQFFAYHSQTLSTVDGIKNCFAVFAAGLISAVCMCLFVERAKKCLDFGVTLYFVDLLLQCFYSEFPKAWDWWIVHLVSMGVTILLGEYLCSRRELEEIPMIDLFSKRSRN